MRKILQGAMLALALNSTPLLADGSITLSTPIGDGIFATGGWSAEGGRGFSITSTWTTNADGSIHFAYHISADPSSDLLSKGISHLILGVSPNVPLDEIIIPGTFTATGGTDMHAVALQIDGDAPKTYSGTDPSNPGLPGSLYGIKWDVPQEEAGTSLWFEFDSLRVAKLGNFYAKDGKDGRSKIDVYAYNSGLNGGDDFIWVPDSERVTLVPEPSTYATLGALLIVAVWAAKRRREGQTA